MMCLAQSKCHSQQAVKGEAKSIGIFYDGATLGVDAKHTVLRVVNAHLLGRYKECAIRAPVHEYGPCYWTLRKASWRYLRRGTRRRCDHACQ